MAPVYWSDLPDDMLEIILRQPTDVVTLYNYRNVCRSWRSVVDKALALSPPHLAVYDKNSRECIRLFNIFSGDSSVCKIPKLKTTRDGHPLLPRGLIHSCHGWLPMDFITISSDINHAHQMLHICLYNPLSRARIWLPTLILEHFDSRNLKFILSISNHTNPSSIALAILEGLHQCLVKKLIFWKPGDEEWTLLHTPSDFKTSFDSVIDIIGYKCGGFCAIDWYGNLTQFELNPVPCAKQIPTGKMYNRNNKVVTHEHSYLVESLSGELLMVNRCFFPQNEYMVYKLDWEKMEWDEITSLGDEAIFLARNQSVCIRAAESTVYRRNCIYFTPEEVVSLFGLRLPRHEDDFGVYDMANKAIHRFTHLSLCHTDLHQYRWLSYTNFQAIEPAMELLKSKPSKEKQRYDA